MAKIECYCVICTKFIGKYYPSLIRKTCGNICHSKHFKGHHSLNVLTKDLLKRNYVKFENGIYKLQEVLK